MTLGEAVAARYARQAAEQDADRETRKPGDPAPASLAAGIEATLRRHHPYTIWPDPGGRAAS